MNCPICGCEIEDPMLELCPECGEPLWQAEKIESSHPGIFYANLDASQEVYEEEHAPKREGRFSAADWRGLIGCSALLICFLLLVWGVSRMYDPGANAMVGKGGIAMSNAEYAIYYYTSVYDYTSENETVYFTTASDMDKQYYNVEAGYSWQDYFMDQSLSSAALTKTLVYEAQQMGLPEPEFELPEESEDLTAYLASYYGPDVTYDVYCDYYRDCQIAQACSDEIYGSMEASQEDIDAVYDTYAGEYAGYDAETITALAASGVKTQMISEMFAGYLQDTDCHLTRFADVALPQE